MDRGQKRISTLVLLQWLSALTVMISLDGLSSQIFDVLPIDLKR